MSRRQRILGKPSWPYVLNKSSNQAKGLVGWWPGDPSRSLTLYDISGHGNHGSINGSISANGIWVPGYQGGKSALTFDGSTNYVQFADYGAFKIPNGQPFSFSYWFKLLSSPSAFDTLFSKGYDGNSEPFFNDFRGDIGGGLTTPPFLSAGAFSALSAPNTAGCVSTVDFSQAQNIGVWWLATTVFTTAGINLYLNGQLNNSASFGGYVLHDTALGVNIGCLNLTGSFIRFAHAMLEDVRFYNRTLSPAEVWNIYSKPWDLRYQLGRVKYFFGGAGGGGTTPVYCFNGDLWNVLSTITQKDVDLWNTRSRLGVGEADLWNVSNKTTKNMGDLWNINAQSSKNNGILWQVCQRLGVSKADLWNCLATIKANEVDLWNILSTTSKSEADLWNTLQIVGSTKGTLWGLGGKCYVYSQDLWNTLSRLGVSETDLWNDFSNVKSTESALWNISQSIKQTDICLWNVGSVAAITLLNIFLWNTLTRANSTNSDIWNTLINAKGTPVACDWNVLTSIKVAESNLWKEMAMCQGSESMLWNTLSALKVSEANEWNTLITTKATESAMWNDRGIVDVTGVNLWNLIGRIQTVNPVLWNTLQRVGVVDLLIWNDTIRALSSKGATWNLADTISVTNMLKRNLRSNSVIYRYTLTFINYLYKQGLLQSYITDETSFNQYITQKVIFPNNE